MVAGPGAGKTFCLIGRIAYLIETHDIPPSRILAVTFTNKAAEEITHRLQLRIGERARDVQGGTLHALSVRLLREFAAEADLPPGFGIADDDYQRHLLQRLGVPRRRLSATLTLFRTRRLTERPLDPGEERLFREYDAALRARGVIDFDEIILRGRDLLMDHPRVAEQVRERFDQVLVDEFQDVSHAQFAILRELVAGHRHIFAVGDDEQSIYSWAGADPEILHRFAEIYAIDAPVVLDVNRRCSRQIFAAARRLLEVTPSLFEKVIDATHTSAFPVTSREFDNDEEELAWLVADLRSDHERHELPWGHVALLYRTHQVGSALEDGLLAAGLPCRMARGRSLLDNPVIAYTLASLRVMVAPDDPVPVEAFASLMLPADLLQSVRTAGSRDTDLLMGLRAYARARPGEPDTKQAWRFVYHVENLHALWTAHDSLPSLLEELLAQRVGAYVNPLQEHADELTDPSAYPGAADLARRLAEALEAEDGEGRIVLARHQGRELGIVDLLAAGGIDNVTVVDVDTTSACIGRDQLTDPDFPVRLFKAIQIRQSRAFRDTFQDFVAFDLETTDKDVDDCEIIEIGAARFRDGVLVDTFDSLVRCTRRIAAGATAVHGYTNDHLRDAPTFDDVWPTFRAFVGDDVLVAHNGQMFDVPVLKRSARDLPGVESLVFYDTLPLARSLFRESAALEAMAKRFGIETGRSHHALDDARTLGEVLGVLNAHRQRQSRIAAAVDGLDRLGLALALFDTGATRSTETERLFRISRVYTLGRFTECLDRYAQRQPTTPEAPPVEEIVERLGGAALRERIQRRRTGSERYPEAFGRLRSLVQVSEGATLDAQVRDLLERVALSTSRDVDLATDRINLLTLHATKGLEFSRVYIVGVEDYQMPGYYASVDNRTEDIEEGRRLLYVGMTRAIDRLVLTCARSRSGRDTGGRRFLSEAGLTPPSG